MRGLFSLLFGAGMYLFLERAWARGQGGMLQARRLFWLMLFGLAHFFFIWWGDILFLYAISGFVALALVRWRASTQLSIGIVWYLIGSLIVAAQFTPAMLLERSAAMQAEAPQTYESIGEFWQDRLDEADAERAAFTLRSYASEFDHVVSEHGLDLVSFYPYFALFETIPLMLIGMGLYRMGLFSGGLDPGRSRPWGWGGVLAGMAMTVPLGLWVVSEGFPPFLTDFAFNGIGQLTRLPMILGLAALLALWAPRAAKSWLGQRIVAAGRMAFSNYIGTSLLVMLVMRHWAGGLWGELDRVGLLVVVLGVWIVILGARRDRTRRAHGHGKRAAAERAAGRGQ
jgi:uncharacterized protein